MNDQEEKKDDLIAAKLVAALTEFYGPAANLAEADETKTTQELIDEMEGIQDSILPWSVNQLMEANNFKLHYNGTGYVWLLKAR